jgi:hypothetical protein
LYLKPLALCNPQIRHPSINPSITMSKVIAALLSVFALLSAPVNGAYTGEPLVNKAGPQGGAAMSKPVDYTPFGKEFTHRMARMNNDILSCMYNVGNLMASHTGDLHVMGTNDRPDMPFRFGPVTVGGTGGCGQCFLFEHKSGRSAIGITGDACPGCPGAFDVSDALSAQLMGEVTNIPAADVKVTPINCNWKGNIQYALVENSRVDYWDLHISRNNVPLASVTATWDEKGTPRTLDGLNKGGTWEFDFSGKGKSRVNPGKPGQSVTITMTGVTGEVLTEILSVQESAYSAPSKSDLGALAAMPMIEGTVQFK